MRQDSSDDTWCLSPLQAVRGRFDEKLWRGKNEPKFDKQHSLPAGNRTCTPIKLSPKFSRMVLNGGMIRWTSELGLSVPIQMYLSPTSLILRLPWPGVGKPRYLYETRSNLTLELIRGVRTVL